MEKTDLRLCNLFMLVINLGCIGRLTAPVGWLVSMVGGHPVLGLHSSNEPGELSQWL